MLSPKSRLDLSNQKSWMNNEIHSLIQALDTAFRTGSREELRAARNRLIKSAKNNYRLQIEEHLGNNTAPRHMWQGTQKITEYRNKTSCVPTFDITLLYVLNTTQSLSAGPSLQGQVLTQAQATVPTCFKTTTTISLLYVCCTVTERHSYKQFAELFNILS